MRPLIAALLLALMPLQALASSFVVVSDRATFLRLVEGKELRIGIYGLSLFVSRQGTITGSAMGGTITGTWDWQDGYFCREMTWAGRVIPRNCQLVETRGGNTVRFIADRGQGDIQAFRLR